MNKPTNLPTPANEPDKGKKPATLLERASGAFGFDKFKPADVPMILEGEKAKKFASRRDTGGRPAHSRKATVPAASTAEAQPDQDIAAIPEVTFAGEKREIVRSMLSEQGFINPDGGASQLLEEFRIVKRQVLATSRAAGSAISRRVLVCSPHPDEGKTFCAVNLAIAMAAERDSEVLLIDGDFGKPSVLSRLGLEADKGFMDVLMDPDARIEDHVIGTDISGLWVIGAGSRTGRDSEYLASDRTREVLDQVTRGAPNRMLIFDSPPALAATPAAELAKHVGQALLVARAGETGKVALEDTIDQLSACPDIRLLLNDATFSPSGRKFGTYYGYDE